MLNTEMILTLNSPSLGCELQPLVVPPIPTLRNDGPLKHLQVTIPNTLTFFQAQAAVDDVPVIAHCNLLNTFGENQWEELRPFTRQIRALKPAHVVQHFTAFRHPSGEKTGIIFPSRFLIRASEGALLPMSDDGRISFKFRFVLRTCQLLQMSGLISIFCLRSGNKQAQGSPVTCRISFCRRTRRGYLSAR